MSGDTQTGQNIQSLLGRTCPMESCFDADINLKNEHYEHVIWTIKLYLRPAHKYLA